MSNWIVASEAVIWQGDQRIIGAEPESWWQGWTADTSMIADYLPCVAEEAKAAKERVTWVVRGETDAGRIDERLP